MKKFLKISGVIAGIFVLIISFFVIYLLYFFDLKTFQTTIKNKIYKMSNKYIYFSSATISFRYGVGIKLNDLKVINSDNKTQLFSAKDGYINFKIIPLLHKKIEITKILFEDGNLLLNLCSNTSKSSTPTSTKPFIPPNIKLNLLVLKNFRIHYKDNHLNINTSNLYLKVKQFSFSKFFPFELSFNSLTGKNLYGKVKIIGNFNFNNSFSPSKMLIKANIEVKNLYGGQFYSYFIKKAGFHKFSGNIEYLKASYDGNLKAYFSSKGIIKLKNFKIKHKTFQNLISTKSLIFKYNYEMKGGHDIDLKKFKLGIDNKINFSGKFNFKNGKIFLKAQSSPLKVDSIKKYSPISLKKIELKKGSLTVKDFILSQNKINALINVKNISGVYNKINFDNITGDIKYADKKINFSGNLKSSLKNYSIKDIDIKKLKLETKIKSSEFNLKSIKSSKILGNFNLFSIISYKNYKNIKIKIDNGTILSQSVTAKIDVNYNNIPYICEGKFGLKNFQINAFISKIDENLLKKFKIKKAENINLIIDLSGNYSKINLNSIKANFYNSEIKYDNYTFSNINGKIICNSKSNSCNFKKLSLKFGDFNYYLAGKISNFLSQNKAIFLKVSTNGIDKIILQKLNLGESSIKNSSVYAEMFIKFKPKFSFELNKAKIKFNNSNFVYKEYNLKNIFGKILIQKHSLKFSNISLNHHDTNYTLNGKIPDIYNKKNLFCIINVKTNKIDSEILKKLSIKAKTIDNVNIDMNILIKILPKFSFLVKNGFVKFNNSNFITPKVRFENINGKLLIKNNNPYFRHITMNFNRGTINLNGKITDNYVNIYINGKNFLIEENNSKHSKKTLKVSKSSSKNSITNAIKYIKKFSEKFKGEIIFDFKNINLYSSKLKKFYGEFKLHNKILSLKNFKAYSFSNGHINIKNFIFDFSKVPNIFKLDAKINNFEAALFTKNKISGIAKNSFIKIYSRFNSPDKFLNNLNGIIFIGIYDGYIHKFAFLGNIFSILNVSQILKFKLPDLTSKGMKYKIIAGRFDIKNGIFKTDKFVLLSHSINLGFDGKFNIVNKKIKGQLVVQPLQTIGNLIGKIPVFGYIFGKKIILLYFKISGTYENPKIIPQPSKTITKKTFNIFKNIFTLPKDVFTNPQKIFLPGAHKQ